MIGDRTACEKGAMDYLTGSIDRKEGAYPDFAVSTRDTRREGAEFGGFLFRLLGWVWGG